MEGYLEKQALFRNRTRYFFVDGATLCYSDAPGGKLKGCILLRCANSVLFEDPYRRITLRGQGLDSVKPKKDSYVLVAPTQHEYVRWRGTIRRLRALSAASMISSSSSFSRLVVGFRSCIKSAVEASILDLSEYSDADFDGLQRRHVAHSERLQRQREELRRSSRTASLTEEDPVPPMKLSQLFNLDSASDAAGGIGGAGSTDGVVEELMAASSSHHEPRPIGGGGTALTSSSSLLQPSSSTSTSRRQLMLPKTNPLHPTTTSANAAHMDPVEALLNPPSKPLLTVPPRPGSREHSVDLAKRRTAADAFSGPAWHYLDVLKHAGGIMSSVQYVANERDLKEFWEMYATSEPGFINEHEHRAILQHLVDEVKATMPALLNDVVAVVLRAYGFSEKDPHAVAILESCRIAIVAMVERFHESLLGELDNIAAETWRSLDTRGDSRVTRSTFMSFYQRRPIVPSSALIDVTLDEVGSHIQRQMLQSATQQVKVGQDGATQPLLRRGECGLANLGNTCYLNSVLQCLAHTPLLRQHLLLGKTRDVTDRATPLCDAMANLFRCMLEGSVPAVAITSVREAINQRTQDFFAGIAQHDAQELMTAVLDGMHEEMNGAAKVPWAPLPDKPSKPDAELALEWWESHTRRNRSPIVDWFHGQTKVVTTCNECGNVSLCFDPFALLSVPIPEDNGNGADRASLGSSTNRSRLNSSSSSSSSGGGSISSDDAEDDDTSALAAMEEVPTAGVWLTVPAEDSPPRLIRRSARPRQKHHTGKTGHANKHTAPSAPVVIPPLDDPSWLIDDLGDSTSAANATAKAAGVVDLERCIASHFRRENLSGADAVYCSRCKKHCKGVRSTTLWRAPYYLTVGLKRFRHDKSGQVLSKNTTPVSVPDRLVLGRWIDSRSDGGPFVAGSASPSASYSSAPSPLYSTAASPSSLGGAAADAATPAAPGGVSTPVAGATSGLRFVNVPSASDGPSANNAEYELYGVIRHSGWISGGHYTALCASQGRWVLYNDGMVVPMEQRGAVDDGAYVLLYRLRRSAVPAPTTNTAQHSRSHSGAS